MPARLRRSPECRRRPEKVVRKIWQAWKGCLYAKNKPFFGIFGSPIKLNWIYLWGLSSLRLFQHMVFCRWSETSRILDKRWSVPIMDMGLILYHLEVLEKCTAIVFTDCILLLKYRGSLFALRQTQTSRTADEALASRLRLQRGFDNWQQDSLRLVAGDGCEKTQMISHWTWFDLILYVT